VLLGSWLGMAFVVGKLPHAIRETYRSDSDERRSYVYLATDEAAVDTRFGRAANGAVDACDIAAAVPFRTAIPA